MTATCTFRRHAPATPRGNCNRQHCWTSQQWHPRRSGFTLIEMLVALVITLIMMGAVVSLFGVISESISGSRSAIEMSDRLRAAREQLQLDLRGLTATMKPPLRPENDEGYLEIIEGRINDSTPYVANLSLALFGDVDDVLMFTTRSRGAPFTGKLGGAIIESPIAEVVYFLAQDYQVDGAGNVTNFPPPVIDATISPAARLYTLYRRVFLVVPGLAATTAFDDTFYNNNDISVRYGTPGGTPTLIPNTLGDLTKRENRFAHYGNPTWTNDGFSVPAVAYGVFPFPVDLRGTQRIPLTWPPEVAGEPPNLPANLPSSWPAGPPRRPVQNAFLVPANGPRFGDDVLLANVLSFDVRVWDADAPVYLTSGVAVEPGDRGWVAAGGGQALGAYVDLGYNQGGGTAFSERNPNTKSGLGSNAKDARIYDTWSLHYENDGVLQNGPSADASTNGLDDGGIVGVVDDEGEYDTQPPYSAPLRGIRVTIRVYEPNSQVVREAVVIQEFLPD